MKARRGLGAVLVLWSSLAAAGPLAQPNIAPGAIWVYHDRIEKGATIKETHDELVVEKREGDGMVVGVKEAGASGPAREQMFRDDWSRFRSVNGKETVVNRPLAFPLAVGKAWRIDYSEENPNPRHSRESFAVPYRVLGWEEVTTPGGVFKALKIEAQGTWSATIAPRIETRAVVAQGGAKRAVVAERDLMPAKTTTGRLYKAFWYAPEVGRWVKSIEEYYDANGARNESYTSELESYHFPDP